MRRLDDLLLLSGNDIPFPEARITIHQPTLKEIAYIGEEAFYTGCEFLNFSKNTLNIEDKKVLDEFTDFDILLKLVMENNQSMRKNIVYIHLVLSLIFPDYSIKIDKRGIVLSKQNEEDCIINNDNYKDFTKILVSIFCLKKNANEDFNPAGEMSKQIAEKLKQRHKKLAEKDKTNSDRISILNRLVSILAVGEQKDMNSLLNYTIYQLEDEYQRFELKVYNDMNFQAKLAGAKDLKEPEDWMKDIHL